MAIYCAHPKLKLLVDTWTSDLEPTGGLLLTGHLEPGSGVPCSGCFVDEFIISNDLVYSDNDIELRTNIVCWTHFDISNEPS